MQPPYRAFQEKKTDPGFWPGSASCWRNILLFFLVRCFLKPKARKALGFGNFAVRHLRRELGPPEARFSDTLHGGKIEVFVGTDEIVRHALPRRVAEPKLVKGMRLSRLCLADEVFHRIKIENSHGQSLLKYLRNSY